MIRTSLRHYLVAIACAAAGAAIASLPAGAQAPAPSGAVALTGARVIDGTGRPAIEQATIVVGADGRVQAVGPGNSVQVPSGATRVNLSGKTIMPGMVNAHAHLQYATNVGGSVRDQLVRRLRLYAEYGVTTIVSLGSTDADEADSIKLRDEQSQGTLDRARLLTSGLVATGRTPDEARRNVDRLAGLKVDVIKHRLDGNANDMNAETMGALIDQAHKKGLRTAIHIFYLKDALAAIDKGVDVIAHSVRDQDVTPQFVEVMKAKRIGYVPTLTRDISVFVYETRPSFFDDPFFLRGAALYRPDMTSLSEPAQQERIKNDRQAQSIKPALQQALKNLKLLSDAGVNIAMGTDSGTAGNPGRWQGYFEHVELEYMVKAGMTPMQTIVAATSGAATAMKIDSVGSIQTGKQADLLVLNENPLTDIMNTRKIDSVWIGGRKLSGSR